MAPDDTDAHVSPAAAAEATSENGHPTRPAPTEAPSGISGRSKIQEARGDGSRGKAYTNGFDRHFGVVDFHADSDFTIRVMAKSAPITIAKFHVVSATVATASPGLREMLYGKDGKDGKEEKNQPIGNQEREIVIDAHPKALNILLWIAHCQFREVPIDTTLDELYEITILTARLNCTQLIFPWAQRWSAPFNTYAGEKSRFMECHKLIWVAWELGNAKMFRDMVELLTVSSGVDAQDNIVNRMGEPLKDMVLPPGILDIVTEARTVTLRKILASISSPLQVLMSGSKDPGVKFCQRGKNETECETMMLGSAIPALAKTGLYPVPEAANYTKSISDLQGAINSINFIPYVGQEWMPHMDHGYCSLGFQDSARRCLEELPIRFDDSTLVHLREQADLSGCKIKFSDTDDAVRLIKTGSTLVKDTWVDPRTKASRSQSSAPSLAPAPAPGPALAPAPSSSPSSSPAPAPTPAPARPPQHQRRGRWGRGDRFNAYRTGRDVSVAATPQPPSENWD